MSNEGVLTEAGVLTLLGVKTLKSLDRDGEEEVGLTPGGWSELAMCGAPGRTAGIYNQKVCSLET